MKRLFILLFSFLISCAVTEHTTLISSLDNYSNFKLKENQLKTWYQKDIFLDSIPGISLERAYQELIKNKKGKEIIVAVLDMQMDINHEDFKDAIWINKSEIPNNNIDDDNNGYIDDVNGWNFLGNNKGGSLLRTNFEYVRIIKKFSNQTKNNISKIKDNHFSKYNIALNEYNENLSIRKNNLNNFNNWYKRYKITKKVLSGYFPNENYTIKKLKSVKTNDSIVNLNINKMINFVNTNKNDEWAIENIELQKRYLNFYLNLNYNERLSVGDNVDDINDTNYGYHNVAINQDSLTHHSTYVAGVLASNRKNNIGIKGFSNNIKIMPIVVSAFGDEHDKDISLAIRYAVDNGAKIINMSSKKEFSLYKKWVQDALIYAKNNNVLFINCTGNYYSNDSDIMDTFPTDIDEKGIEIVNNFINVGSSSYHLNKNLISYFSNYGKNNVDLFAPGENIYTTEISNKYKFKNGTSFSAPIVSGVAALVMSYYPKLKAHQVKEILLVSGVSYNIDVEITGEDGKKKLVPFSSLSKSGKIVNAYNALLYAKNYKKWKAGKWPKK